MSLLQQFFAGGGKPADLESRYAIKCSRHGTYGNLCLFKYNQIDSPFGEPIVREARGIILDEACGWRVVSRSLGKFFNHGEGHASSIDWSTARVQEKVDGSLVVLFHYDGGWRVQTSGMADAAGEVNGCGFSFADLFWKTWSEQKLDLPYDVEQDWCFAFELTSPWNRVVVPHKEARLTLLAVRNRETGAEMAVERWAMRYPVVRSFPLQSVDDVLATFASMNPLQQEGYVIVDGAFNRVKVKHPGYVAIHHLRDGFGPKRLVEIIRAGEAPELLTYYPEWTDRFNEIQSKYDALVREVEADYERLRDIPVQKDFAIEAVKTRCSGALFCLRNGRSASVRAHLASVTVNKLMDLLGVRDAQETVE